MPSEPFNIMEAIWNSVDKASDDCVYYPLAFIDFLWDNGFADTKQFSKEVWRAAFKPFEIEEGIYRLNKNEFLSLDKYRYQGIVRVPFDAMRINEGKYTDEGFGELVRDAIAPSSNLQNHQLKNFIEDLKKESRQADGLILIKTAAKQKIKKLLDENPSPLRRLELMFDEMLKSQGIAKAPLSGASPDQRTALQASAFTTGPITLSEQQAIRLKQVTKAKIAQKIPPEETLEPLKKVKRSKKGLRA